MAKYGAKKGGRASGYDPAGGDSEDDILPDVEAPADCGPGLSPALVKEVKRLVTGGTAIPTAVTAVGGGQMAKHWAEKGRAHRAKRIRAGFEAGQSPERAFLEAMEQAQAARESIHVMRVDAASLLDWKAAAWLLERQSAKRFHLQSKLTVEATNGKQLEITSFSTDKLLQLAKGILPAESIKETLALPSGDDVTDGELVEEET